MVAIIIVAENVVKNIVELLIHIPFPNVHVIKRRKTMKISLPNVAEPINGVLRDVTRFDKNHWQIKITTDLSNIQNLYLTLDDEEITFIKQEINREEVK